MGKTSRFGGGTLFQSLVRMSGGGVPKRVLRYRRSGCWGVISHLRDVFGSSGKFFLKVVGFKAREGSRLQFLVDDWMGVGPLSFLFLRISRWCYLGKCQYEESQYESILSLPFNIFLCRDEDDVHIWKPNPSSLFS